jgi:hypothetical protein
MTRKYIYLCAAFEFLAMIFLGFLSWFWGLKLGLNQDDLIPLFLGLPFHIITITVFLNANPEFSGLWIIPGKILNLFLTILWYLSWPGKENQLSFSNFDEGIMLSAYFILNLSTFLIMVSPLVKSSQKEAA